MAGSASPRKRQGGSFDINITRFSLPRALSSAGCHRVEVLCRVKYHSPEGWVLCSAIKCHFRPSYHSSLCFSLYTQLGLKAPKCVNVFSQCFTCSLDELFESGPGLHESGWLLSRPSDILCCVRLAHKSPKKARRSWF